MTEEMEDKHHMEVDVDERLLVSVEEWAEFLQIDPAPPMNQFIRQELIRRMEELERNELVEDEFPEDRIYDNETQDTNME